MPQCTDLGTQTRRITIQVWNSAVVTQSNMYSNDVLDHCSLLKSMGDADGEIGTQAGEETCMRRRSYSTCHTRSISQSGKNSLSTSRPRATKSE